MTKEQLKKITLIVIGVFFIAFGIFAMDFGIWRGHPDWVFWLCYWGMVIVGFGILTENSWLILSQLNILLIPLLFWDIDFIYFLLYKKSLWNIADYFFGKMMWLARFISFEHLFLIPLALLTIYLIKLKRVDAWKLSLLQMLLFFMLSRWFTDPDYNVNCVFVSCFPFFRSDAWHPARWFLIIGGFVLITNLIMAKIPRLRKN